MEEIQDLPPALPLAMLGSHAVGRVGGAALSPREPGEGRKRVADKLFGRWCDAASAPDYVGALRMYGSDLRDDESAGVTGIASLQPTVETQVTGLRESQQELSSAIGVGGANDLCDGVAHLQEAAQGTTDVLRENLASMRSLLAVGHALNGLAQRRSAFLSRLPRGDARADRVEERMDELLDYGEPTEDMALAITRVAVQTLRDSIQTLRVALQARACGSGLSEADRQTGRVALDSLRDQVAELEAVLAGMAQAQERMELI
ncbi:MAG: hypothetical protein ACYCW6_04420 [Candidatus Xenobia bacterium]